MSEESCVRNAHIKSMDVDVLYHIGLATDTSDLKKQFGDIKVNSGVLF